MRCRTYAARFPTLRIAGRWTIVLLVLSTGSSHNLALSREDPDPLARGSYARRHRIRNNSWQADVVLASGSACPPLVELDWSYIRRKSAWQVRSSGHNVSVECRTSLILLSVYTHSWGNVHMHNFSILGHSGCKCARQSTCDARGSARLNTRTRGGNGI